MTFEPGEFDGLRILLVDDDATTRALVRQLCTRAGVGYLRSAHTAEAALAIITQGMGEEFNLIVSDWNMPGLSGLDLLEQLRTWKWSVPFIMMTARHDKDSELAAKEGGVTSYLVKPFSPDDFYAQLRKAAGHLGRPS